MVRSTNLQASEAASRRAQESRKTKTKGTELLTNMRVAGKRGAGGDNQGRQVRQERQNQAGNAGKVKPQHKSSLPSSITP